MRTSTAPGSPCLALPCLAVTEGIWMSCGYSPSLHLTPLSVESPPWVTHTQYLAVTF